MKLNYSKESSLLLSLFVILSQECIANVHLCALQNYCLGLKFKSLSLILIQRDWCLLRAYGTLGIYQGLSSLYRS